MSAVMCPDCGSFSVEYSELAGGLASCRACPWQGSREKLVGVNLQVDVNTDEALMALRSDIRVIVKNNASAFISILARWGFVDVIKVKGKIQVKNSQQALRYVNAIATSVLTAIVEERKKIEVERVNGN